MNFRNRFSLLLGVFFSLLGIVQIQAQDYYTHNFNDGDLGPFKACEQNGDEGISVRDGRVKTYWSANDPNSDTVKGVELCNSSFTSLKETWMGFTMNIAPKHQSDTQSAVAQLVQFTDDNTKGSWTGMLKYEYGDLRIVHRAANNTKNIVDKVIFPEYPKDEDVNIIVHYMLSADKKGLIEVWIDDILKYKNYHINFGFGTWNESDVQVANTYVVPKIGQYNYMNEEYVTGEERIIYYDNIAWYNGGSEGYNMVNPLKSASEDEEFIAAVPAPQLVHITKKDAPQYAIDGNMGGENGQNVYLYTENSASDNQLWYEIDRGNGYFSYQKYGTNFCLNGDNTGKSKQSVYLWSKQDQNYNQHWKKEVLTDGSFKLVKRNAPAFAIASKEGGKNKQNINLAKAKEKNQSIAWTITPIYDDFVTRIEAEEFVNMAGIQTEASTESGENLALVNDGDWTQYNQVNLNGAKSFTARVASTVAGGELQVRAGSKDGDLLATLNIENTGGSQQWKSLSTTLQNAGGVKDIYLVYKGSKGRNLYNVNWIEFSSKTPEAKDMIATVNEEPENVSIYPNPVSSITTLANAKDAEIRIYDVNGSVVFKTEVGNDKETLNLSKLKKGTYYTEVSNNDMNAAVKLVKN